MYSVDLRIISHPISTFFKKNSNCLIPHAIIQKVQEIHPWQPLGKYFFILALDPLRTYLAWIIISFSTFQLIYDTFKLGLKWWKIDTFSINWRTVNCKISWNVPLGSLMCLTNWHWTPIIVECCKQTLYPPNSIVENSSNGHSLDSSPKNAQ